MNIDHVQLGMPVRTTPESRCTLIADPQYLKNRREGHGVIWGVLTQHTGSWWVMHHDDFSLAPYWFHEMEPDDDPPQPARFTLV
jgi:hypothetical protein